MAEYCSSCKSNWSKAEFSPKCRECSGFALLRHCPMCQGRCGSMWKRDVYMSNSFQEAYYAGDCLFEGQLGTADRRLKW